jgi:Glycosyltransferase family 87
VELRLPARLTRLLAALVAVAALAAVAAGPASAAPELRSPPSQTVPPAGYELTAKRAIRIAARTEVVREQRERRGDLRPAAYTRGPGRWQVSWFDGDREVAQVRVDDSLGIVLEEWAGHQVAWSMARGYEGAFGRKLNAPYVWIPLCVAFLLPFLDPRRPFRPLHLDLAVLLAFGASHVFFNRGEIGVSVPLVYPILLYLLARMLWIGARPRGRGERLVPWLPIAWVALATVFLVAFRVGLDVVDSNVIDVGYAGVVGADRIADGDELYGPGFAEDVGHGDTYGPLTYLAYVPFEQVLPWSGEWDELPAARGAAIAFDLLTLLGLLALGLRLRPGRAGRELGIALAYAWAAYPYAAFALQTNSNDTLVGLCTVAAMLGLTLAPARRGLSAAARGAAVALGAAAKFAPLALAPLFALADRGPTRRATVRSALVFAAALAVVLDAAFLPFLPDGGPRELYDRTVGYQASRGSPFSVWGQIDSGETLRAIATVAAIALAVAVAFVPRRRAPVQVAALGAAVLIAVQLAASHWFYLYVVWFAPLVLVAVFAATAQPPPAPARSTWRARRALRRPRPRSATGPPPTSRTERSSASGIA